MIYTDKKLERQLEKAIKNNSHIEIKQNLYKGVKSIIYIDVLKPTSFINRKGNTFLTLSLVKERIYFNDNDMTNVVGKSIISEYFFDNFVKVWC